MVNIESIKLLLHLAFYLGYTVYYTILENTPSVYGSFIFDYTVLLQNDH
jgi:hypothetical protein